jgi:hypothetical protein
VVVAAATKQFLALRTPQRVTSVHNQLAPFLDVIRIPAPSHHVSHPRSVSMLLPRDPIPDIPGYCVWCSSTDVLVAVKWQGKKFDIELDTEEPGSTFKFQIFSLTGVPPERQKVLIKGGPVIRLC